MAKISNNTIFNTMNNNDNTTLAEDYNMLSSNPFHIAASSSPLTCMEPPFILVEPSLEPSQCIMLCFGKESGAAWLVKRRDSGCGIPPSFTILSSYRDVPAAAAILRFEHAAQNHPPSNQTNNNQHLYQTKSIPITHDKRLTTSSSMSTITTTTSVRSHHQLPPTHVSTTTPLHGIVVGADPRNPHATTTQQQQQHVMQYRLPASLEKSSVSTILREQLSPVHVPPSTPTTNASMLHPKQQMQTTPPNKLNGAKHVVVGENVSTTSVPQEENSNDSPHNDSSHDSMHDSELALILDEELLEIASMRCSPFKKITTTESGDVQVNHGTWSKEEHELFIIGLKEVGRNWELIANGYIKSRVRSQVASHGKYHVINC